MGRSRRRALPQQLTRPRIGFYAGRLWVSRGARIPAHLQTTKRARLPTLGTTKLGNDDGLSDEFDARVTPRLQLSSNVPKLVPLDGGGVRQLGFVEQRDLKFRESPIVVQRQERAAVLERNQRYALQAPKPLRADENERSSTGKLHQLGGGSFCSGLGSLLTPVEKLDDCPCRVGMQPSEPRQDIVRERQRDKLSWAAVLRGFDRDGRAEGRTEGS